MPNFLKEFLKNNDCLNKIRKYNAAFSFITFNATQDKNLSNNNIYTMRIQGQIHHRIGPLEAKDDDKLICAQVYFKGENECEARQK